ncbi:MAG: hypothetical protein ACRCT8_15930 [Lacipirellulaceae bacterium]
MNSPLEIPDELLSLLEKRAEEERRLRDRRSAERADAAVLFSGDDRRSLEDRRETPRRAEDVP